MTVFYNLVASWWNDFWSKITVLEPLLLQNTVNTNVLRRFLQQIHPPTATRSENAGVARLVFGFLLFNGPFFASKFVHFSCGVAPNPKITCARA